MQGTGAAVAAVFGSMDPVVSVGSKCNAEQGMSSLTAEKYGIISCLVLIHVLLMRHHKNATIQHTISVWIDNEEALRRINTKVEDDVRLKSHGVRDYGYLVLMRDLRDCIPDGIKILWKKVKSHQQGTREDLPFEAHLNEAADQMANKLRTTYYGPINKYDPYYLEGMILRDKNLVKINDIEPAIRNKIRGEELREYLMQRNGWKLSTLLNIDWNGLEKVLKSMPLHRRFKLLQLIYNWQNVGSQKQCFLESAEKPIPYELKSTAKLRTAYQTNMGTCPFQCGQKERNMHYMSCPSISATNTRTQLVTKFRASLTRYDIHPSISSLLIYGMLWKPTSLPPTCTVVNKTSLNNEIQQAIGDQTLIGWDKVSRGLISSRWAQIQRTYCSHKNTTPTTDWNKFLLKQVLEVSWGMWEARNKSLHGTNVNDVRKKKLDILILQVDHLYERAKIFMSKRDSELSAVFKLQRKQRIKKSLGAITSWIKLATAVLVKVEKREAGNIEKWLTRKETYIGKG